MKKVVSFLVCFVVVALAACTMPVAIIASVVHITELSHTEYLQKNSGLDLSGCTVISAEDTHGGFHGDGVLIVTIDCTEIASSVFQQTEDWNSLPLSDDLQSFLYGGECTLGNGDRAGIPELTNGRYFFWDRHSQSADPTSDRELFERSSLNFSLVLYDTDRSRLYLFELDT